MCDACIVDEGVKLPITSRMPMLPVNGFWAACVANVSLTAHLAGEATLARPHCLCGVLQLGTTSSRHWANASCFGAMASACLGFSPRRSSEAGWSRRYQTFSSFRGMTHESVREGRSFVTFLTHFSIFPNGSSK